MNFINWEPLLESLKRPLLKMLKDLIEESKEDGGLYVKKATACRMLDCDGKTFNDHFAGALDIYYLGDSTIKRYLRSDIEDLANKVPA